MVIFLCFGDSPKCAEHFLPNQGIQFMEEVDLNLTTLTSGYRTAGIFNWRIESAQASPGQASHVY